MSRKKAAAPATVGTLGDVTPGDSCVLESGLVCELGFVLGQSAFVRFSDNHEPRCVSSLPASTAVVSVIRRERVATTANGAVDDPVSGGGK